MYNVQVAEYTNITHYKPEQWLEYDSNSLSIHLLLLHFPTPCLHTLDDTSNN